MQKTVSPRNLVLGCGTGYSPEQILPFIQSLRDSGFGGEVALVIDEDQQELLAGLAGQYSMDLIPIRRYPSWLPAAIGSRLQNRGKMHLIHRALGMVLPGVLRNGEVLGFLGKHLHYFFHIACGRYLCYYSYLHARRGRYSNVLLSDVRDVIFQADPFSYSSAEALCCFIDSGICLCDEPINTEWMTTTFGPDYCASRSGRRISCSGTTLGYYSSIMDYLQKMSVELVRVLPRISGLHGVDQSVHNHLIWEGKLPGVNLCENGQHAVMTLKNADPGAFRMDEEGQVFNQDGKLAPVLHQHEFHPELVRRKKL